MLKFRAKILMGKNQSQFQFLPLQIITAIIAASPENFQTNFFCQNIT